MDDNRRVIAGLGNPGRQYERNRHNIGFMAVDELARKHGLTFDKMMSKGMVALGEIARIKVALVKPQTFMNASGQCVGPVLKFYKSTAEDLLVLYDELDLPAGQLRMRKSGSAGGHNGMKSIIQTIGTQEFPRLRMGIGRPPGRMDPAAYVLQNFDAGERADVVELIDRAVAAVEIWLTAGIEPAMNRANAAPK
ncbi:MAG: aminoacyl-tRNA hydrolase [Chloroflexi bacterium]|nr:aminoacyl-tRNA hydrolase [Chloroflexota bacterium]